MTIPHDFACPTWLAERLRVHGDRHGPHYQGFLSDHLPMALLAMGALGDQRPQLEAYAHGYADRLDPRSLHAGKVVGIWRWSCASAKEQLR